MSNRIGCYALYGLSVVGVLVAAGLALMVDTPEKLLHVLVIVVALGVLGLGALLVARTEPLP